MCHMLKYMYAVIDVVIVYRREQFIQWTESLGDYQTPSWLGLPNSAETVLLTSLGLLSSFTGNK